MAKIQEEIVLIKISQLTRDGSEAAPRINEDVITALAQVAEELVGPGAVVEIERA